MVREIAELWQTVLHLDYVADDDNFFEIGGNSIGAIRLVPLIHERFGLELPITMIFDHPTPVALAEALSALMDPD